MKFEYFGYCNYHHGKSYVGVNYWIWIMQLDLPSCTDKMQLLFVTAQPLRARVSHENM